MLYNIYKKVSLIIALIIKHGISYHVPHNIEIVQLYGGRDRYRHYGINTASLLYLVWVTRTMKVVLEEPKSQKGLLLVS